MLLDVLTLCVVSGDGPCPPHWAEEGGQRVPPGHTGHPGGEDHGVRGVTGHPVFSLTSTVTNKLH